MEDNQTEYFNPREHEEKFAEFLPLASIACGLACIVLFLGINIEGTKDYESLLRWGAPSSAEIWSGHIWGLISTNFVHVRPMHIIFNLYWLWVFGKKIEFEVSMPFYIGFIVSSAFLAAIWEMAIFGQAGIGFSGINYAFFGFLFVKSRFDKTGRWYLDQNVVVLMFVWLFACIFLTFFDIYPVANGAHFAGVAWGITVGFLVSQKSIILKTAIPLIILGASAIPAFWSPWSVTWLSVKALEHHRANDIEGAKGYYNRVLEKDPSNRFATGNLGLIRIYELGKEANLLFEKGDRAGSRLALEEILKIDPENAEAKEGLSKLQ